MLFSDSYSYPISAFPYKVPFIPISTKTQSTFAFPLNQRVPLTVYAQVCVRKLRERYADRTLNLNAAPPPPLFY